jgi:hypothetical protein
MRGSLSPGIFVKKGCLGGIYGFANRLGGGLCARRTLSVPGTYKRRVAAQASDKRAHARRRAVERNRAKADTGIGRNVKSRRVLYGKTFCPQLTQ